MPFLRRTSTLDRDEFGSAGSKLFTGLTVGCSSFGVDGETLDELLLAANHTMLCGQGEKEGLFAELHSLSTNDLGQYRMM